MSELPTNFQLTRDSFSRLVFSCGEQIETGVIPVRAFPMGAPATGIALVSAEGRELAWIERLADLPQEISSLISAELAQREFMPEIKRIISVSRFACPSTWQVDTERGTTQLLLKGEEDIRRLSDEKLLIADAHGIQYLIRDLSQMDRLSRKILDRFL